MDNPYSEAYFLHGRENGLSLYENYSWKPSLTRPMVRAIMDHLFIVAKTSPHIQATSVLDFGAARGYTVRALREIGVDAWGVDCSLWAVQNCDPAVEPYVRYGVSADRPYDWIWAKDVLEHVEDLWTMADNLMMHARKGLFIVVPLSEKDGEPYVVPEYELDVTHRHRFTLASWANLFMRPGWAVTAQYRLGGVKDNYSHHLMGNGFITCRRLA